MVEQRVTSLFVFVALLVSVFGVSVARAPQAQADPAFGCDLYLDTIARSGQASADAAEHLRAHGEPNPPGIENALDIIADHQANVPPSGSRPSIDAADLAYRTLGDYYAAICEPFFVDTCRLAVAAVRDAGSSSEARLLRALETPAPPGIDAALAVLGGEIQPSESPFHDTVEQAADQIRSYYSTCFDVGVTPFTANAAVCSAARQATSLGGLLAVAAIGELRVLSPANPDAVEQALDTIIDFEDGGASPTSLEWDQAIRLVDAYFAPACDGIDICAYVNQAVATNDGSSAEAAALLRGIESPAPPGIDAALALIAGQIDESPFHASIAEAQAQIEGYYPCGPFPPIQGTPYPSDEIIEICGDLGVIGIPEGPFAIEAAERLRARGAPNPPGIEAALDVIVNAASGVGAFGDADEAFLILDGYFGGPCGNIDTCALVSSILGSDQAASQLAADRLRRIETPAPPGIDAALALIAGQIDSSPFHESVADAKTQIRSYYPCTIVFTGTSATVPLSIAGFSMIATGGLLLAVRRRLDS